MKKYKLIEILMDCLVFCLTAGSLSAAFLRAIYLPMSVTQILLITISLYVILRIVFWNKWTAAVILPLSALIGFLVIYRMPEPMEWLHSVLTFLKWQIDYIGGKTVFRWSYYLSTAWFWISLIGVVYFLLLVKLRWFLLPFALGTALLFVLWFLGHKGILWFLWLFALGCILLWGGSFHKKLSKRFSVPHYGMWLVYVLPLAILILLTARILIPVNTDYRWPFLVESVDKIEDRFNDRFGFSGPRQPFRLSETGFPSSQDKLGGPVLISEDLVLEVSSPIPLYLRGSLLNEYISTGWQDTIDDMRYRFRDAAWEKVRRNVYNFDERIWRDQGKKQLDVFFPEIETVITHVGIESSAIFHSLQLTDIDTVKGASLPYFNTKGETFTTREVNSNEPYTLRSRVPDMTNPEFIRYLTEEVPSLDWNQPLPESLLEDEAYREKALAIQKHYMKIPDSVPERVYDLTEEITAGKETSYEKIMAIQDYLHTHFTYTLRPPYTPADRDFVDYFLFELKEGYCTYFASAMAVMGRATGIPTRYAEGFLMPSVPNSKGIYEVKKLNGHAWTEVYFPQVGWLPFDPTPPDALVESVGEGAYSSDDQEVYWQDYWEHMMEEQQTGRDIIVHDLPDPDNSGTAANTDWTLLKVVFGVLAALASLSAIAALILFLWYHERWKKADREPLRQRLHIYYSEILWFLKLYGSPVKQGETPYEHAKRVDSWLVNSAGSMMDISRILVGTEFGNHTLSEADLTRVKEFYQNLKANIRDVMGYGRFVLLLVRRMFTGS